MNVFIVRKNHAGFICLTDIVNGQLIEQKYQGYTLTEAKRLFNKYIKSIKEGVK
jgi:hypothetical protein